MKLLVIRHGPAGDPEAWKEEGRDDRLRPLTPEGKKEMRKAAAGLATLIPELDVLVTSPLVRASQTAEIVGKHYNCEIATDDSLLPDQDPEKTARAIRERGPSDTVAVVGHEPHLSRFVSYLLAGKRESFIDLKKGGACLLDLERPASASATLNWLLTRRELIQLGETR